MYECYINDVFLIYLPPHTSHILQPLDLTVFSVLKSSYRRLLQQLVRITDNTSIGKAQFLTTYAKARALAMKPETIKAGWKSTGLWPISVAKPLMNPLLLGRSRQRDNQQIKQQKAPSQDRLRMPWITFMTPSRSQQVRDAVTTIEKGSPMGNTARLLFRKVGTTLDRKNTKIADLEMKILLLEAQLEHYRPKKRKKVKPGPNDRFVGIKQV